MRVRKLRGPDTSGLVQVDSLDAEQRLIELAEMLGADTKANRSSARDLLRAGAAVGA